MDGYSLGDIDRARMAVSTMSPWTQDDRNNIIAMSYSDRPTVRDCPMNRSGRSLRELEIVAAQQPRRRIALAVCLLETSYCSYIGSTTNTAYDSPWRPGLTMFVSVPVAGSEKSNVVEIWETELAALTVEILARIHATSSEYV
jgi:hypothetical protein